jgi:hypothetical protein
MSTFDEVTLEEAAARRRGEVRVASVRPCRSEEGRRREWWCEACRSPSCHHVLELLTTSRCG